MSVKVVERPEFGRLVGPRADKDKPVYNWHAYKHSFSGELVTTLLNEFGAQEGDWVLDPFCGGGTTLLAAQEKGINSRGIDILPFPVFLTNARLAKYNFTTLNKYATNLARTKSPKQNMITENKYFNDSFTKPILNAILTLKKSIVNIPSEMYQKFFMLALCDIVEKYASREKSGAFLRNRKKMRGSWENVISDFNKIVNKQIKDIKERKKTVDYQTDSKAIKGDVRAIKFKRKFDFIITSPPYLNRHDYTRIYALELFLNFTDTKGIKEMRYNTIRSHVEARKVVNSESYKPPKELIQVIDKIEKRGVNNSKVPGMILGYFEDMYLAMSKVNENMKSGGKAVFVISNVRFSGVDIPVDKMLQNAGTQAGLTPDWEYVTKYKGNSPQQMERFGRKKSPEVVLIFKK